jgi:hypothetical protein
LPSRIVHLPDPFIIDGKIRGSRVRQVKRASGATDVDVLERDRAGRRFGSPTGQLLVTARQVDAATDREWVLQVRSLDVIETAENARSGPITPRWVSPAPLDPASMDPARMRDACGEVLDSWIG